jgi:malate dehydrogenase (oxaloacetate-decarboxylating)(NADP+)
MTWRLQFASMMLRKGLVDGMVCGVGNTYTEMLRPIFALVPKTAEANHSAGVHLVMRRNEITFFADTTAVIKPTPAQIAETAWSTADMAKRFDVEPRVALISFSTFGSVDHPDVEKVREALAIVREKRPDIVIDGEMRVDTALMPEFCKENYPFSKLGGKANVLIFPDVSTGNIAYKIAESYGGSLVLGPFLTGLERPVSMLTRYATVDNVLHASVMAAMLALSKNPHGGDPIPSTELLERMVKP